MPPLWPNGNYLYFAVNSHTHIAKSRANLGTRNVSWKLLGSSPKATFLCRSVPLPFLPSFFFGRESGIGLLASRRALFLFVLRI